MATNYTVLVILCFAAFGSHRQPDSHLLREKEKRERIIHIARGELGVREAIGNNDGRRVEEYLATTGLRRGSPWCAAFISWIFAKAGYKEPCTAWSPALFNNRVDTKEVKPANILGIWFADKQRIAHVGLIERRQDDWLLSIEGNTNVMGSREGDGVYRKRRHMKTIYCYADWIAKERRR